MRCNFALGLAILWLGTASGTAEAARLSLVGVGNSADPAVPGTGYSGETAYGGGVLLEMRTLPLIGFEIGALYAPRKYSYSTSTSDYTLSYNTYEFPVLLRLHLGRYLSVGAGGYYARSNGGISETTMTGGTSSSQGVSFASQQQSNSDYGAILSAALTMRIAPLTRLLFDGRYLMGLKNDSLASGGSMKFNDMELLAGLQFGF